MTHQWTWQLLRAGSFRLDGGSMFGVVPKPIWSKLVTPDEQNRIPLQTNCLLLSRDDRLVLIEAGFGDKWSEKERGFYDLERRCVADAVRETGSDPEDVTDVIVTHLHFDHAGGLTMRDPSGEVMSVFPHARVHVQRQEWKDALHNRSTMSRTYLRDHLDPIAEQVGLIDGEAEPVPGITVWPMPGHTWGQQAVRFADEAGEVCFAGDVMPTIHHVGSAFSMGYDMLPYDNMLNKKSLLERAEAERWRIVLDHEPGEPVVMVGRDADRSDRFTLTPVERA